MKKYILILFGLIFIFSCDSVKIDEMNDRIFELEKLNKELVDSINELNHKRVISSQLVGISEKNDLTINQSNKFMFLFSSSEKLPDYNVYEIVQKGEDRERKLLYENLNSSNFMFEFTPKDEFDKSFVLLAEFDLDSIKVQIPGVMNMK